MSFDLAESDNVKKSIELMFGKIMDGVEKTFKWPSVELLSVEHTHRYSSREVMTLRFNVFKNTTFSTPGEKYEIVGEQAGIYLQSNCDGHIPSNVELGEN